MEIQMMGHPSMLVKTHDCRVLINPVLWNRDYEQDTPFPDVDLLVISYRYPDYLDLRNLGGFPKCIDVLIPDDDLIASRLRRLGFLRLHRLREFTEVKLGSTRICTTRSERRIPEFGVLFEEESDIFWNQIDSVVSPTTIDFLVSRYSRIDFLLVSQQYQPGFPYGPNRALIFPYEEYGKLLYNVSLIRPKAIAPGANGFSSVGGSSWLSRIVFPVTREEFCRDVRLAWPELGDNIFELDARDSLTFGDGHIGSKIVRKTGDCLSYADFAPKLGQGLKDPDPDNESVERMMKSIIEEVEVHLPAFIDDNHSAFAEHRDWNVIYELDVVFRGGRRSWFFDFSSGVVAARRGRNPLSNFLTCISATSFYAMLKKKHGWDYAILEGHYRRFTKVYSVTPLGLNRPEGVRIADLLSVRFQYSPGPRPARLITLAPGLPRGMNKY